MPKSGNHCITVALAVGHRGKLQKGEPQYYCLNIQGAGKTHKLQRLPLFDHVLALFGVESEKLH